VRPTARIGGTLGVLLVVACTREQEPELCPDVAPGDLVIAELRGEQSGGGADLDGAWIELYNAGGATDLEGLEVVFSTGDGKLGVVHVRRSVPLPAGERAVLSYRPEDRRPAYSDYGWYPDFIDTTGNPQDLFAAGSVEIRACGLRIDQMTYAALPDLGSWSLGVDPPDDVANDDAAAWCDAAAPGTPGESNPPCP
jgi:hypothetical protein